MKYVFKIFLCVYLITISAISLVFAESHSDETTTFISHVETGAPFYLIRIYHAKNQSHFEFNGVRFDSFRAGIKKVEKDKYAFGDDMPTVVVAETSISLKDFIDYLNILRDVGIHTLHCFIVSDADAIEKERNFAWNNYFEIRLPKTNSSKSPEK